MGHPAAADAQRQYTLAVLANQLLLAHRWGRPCRACNVCIRPSSTGAAALAAIKASALRLEPSLLRVPERALHANLAWLLPMHQEFDRPEDELWQRHGTPGHPRRHPRHGPGEVSGLTQTTPPSLRPTSG